LGEGVEGLGSTYETGLGFATRPSLPVVAKLVHGSFDRNIFRHQNHHLNKENIFLYILFGITEE